MTDSIKPETALHVKHTRQLAAMLADCGIEAPEGKRILEVGYKNGLFLQACAEAGMTGTGVEVSAEQEAATRERLGELDLVLYDGGRMPLTDGRFDLVVSFQVLEHVGSVETTLDESLRVLKDGGVMYHVCPNYRSFYEGHYRVVWQPWLTKRLGRWYLKLRGRYTPYYEGLNRVTPGRLRRWARRQGAAVEMISLGRAEFVRKFDREQIEKVQIGGMRAMLRALQRLGPVGRTMLRAIAWGDVYYPITLIVRKRG